MSKEDINKRTIKAIDWLLNSDRNLSKAILASELNTKPSKFSEILNGRMNAGTDIMSLLCEKYGISSHWLLTGAGEMLISGDSPVAHQAEGSNRTAIPLIPYDAIAGYGSFDFQELPIEDFYIVEELRGADFLIRVKGDSMSPKYNGGDIVACKRIDAITFWQWHKVYAICTRNQGILIKRVEEYPNNPAFITCRSENPQYRPFELHEDEIVSVALVLGAIVLE